MADKNIPKFTPAMASALDKPKGSIFKSWDNGTGVERKYNWFENHYSQASTNVLTTRNLNTFKFEFPPSTPGGRGVDNWLDKVFSTPAKPAVTSPFSTSTSTSTGFVDPWAKK